MPKLALNLLVLNGEHCLPRMLRSIDGAIDELVVVDTGSTDRSRQILQEFAIERRIPYTCHPLSYRNTLDYFFIDSPDVFPQTWFPTNKPVLADWAAARNLALDSTKADYVLKMDADDEMKGEGLDVHLSWLDQHHDKYFVSSFYDIMDGNHLQERQMYTRLWRRARKIRWTQPMHEYLIGKTFPTTHTCENGSLRVVDWRDSQGAGVRIPFRNLKVLEWHRLTHPGAMDDDSRAAVLFRYTWACEMAVQRPGAARDELVRLARLVAATDSAFLADVYYHMGRTYEVEGSVELATAFYLKASEQVFLLGHIPSLIRLVRMLDTAEHREHNRDALKYARKLLMRATTGPLPMGCNLRDFAAITEAFSNHQLERTSLCPP